MTSRTDEEGRPSDLQSTAVLLARARSGETAAREELARRYLVTLRRWAHGRLPQKARGLVDTDDLVQATLARAFRRLDEFEPRREEAFLAYLRQILLNQVRDEARRGQRIPDMTELPEELPSHARSPIEEVIGREYLSRYESALGQLSEGQREAVILRIELGFRYREIAESMELSSANAARMLVSRALVVLGKFLKEKNDGED